MFLLYNVTTLPQVTNPQSMQAPTVLMMNLKGRIVPNGGGRETQLDCNLLYNVSMLRQASAAARAITESTYFTRMPFRLALLHAIAAFIS
jgi:hypothetical protein